MRMHTAKLDDMTTLYKNCIINGQNTSIAVCDGKIVDCTRDILLSADVCDLKGLKLYPGLIDIHTHGCDGCDTMDADNDSINKMSKFLIAHGTTSFLPTTMTESIDSIKKALSINTDVSGAEILGFHMEGPYINKEKKGAQNEEFIKDPDARDFKGYFGDKGIKIVTLAPELYGSLNYIRSCKAKISIGHTNADYTTSMNAMRAGACCLTHTYNAMPPFLHRDVGPIGAAIDSNIYIQAITDGLHLDRSIVTMLYRTFTKDKMIIISDSMRATGLSDGEYMFGGQVISVKNSVAKVKSSGAIAGSTSTLFDCVKKAIEFGIPEEDAFYMASSTPAKFLGIENKGNLQIGSDADIIGVDEDLNLKLVIKNGVRVL